MEINIWSMGSHFPRWAPEMVCFVDFMTGGDFAGNGVLLIEFSLPNILFLDLGAYYMLAFHF